MQFFFEIMNMPPEHCSRLMNLIMQIIQIHFFDQEQLSEVMRPFISVLCRKICEVPVMLEKSEKPVKKEYYLGYIKILLHFVE